MFSCRIKKKYLRGYPTPPPPQSTLYQSLSFRGLLKNDADRRYHCFTEPIGQDCTSHFMVESFIDTDQVAIGVILP